MNPLTNPTDEHTQIEKLGVRSGGSDEIRRKLYEKSLPLTSDRARRFLRELTVSQGFV